MEYYQKLQNRGAVIKEEKVKSLKLFNLEDTLILENYESFPGYYGKNLPDGSRPRTIFLVMAQSYNNEELARTLIRANQKMQMNCNENIGTIKLFGEEHHCVRFKYLECFERVVQIVHFLKDEGISFQRYREIDTNALIKIEKVLLLEELGPGLYKDAVDSNKFYFEVPYHFSWKDFKLIATKVRFHLSNNLFDAAQGYIWTVDGLKDIVRIYDRNRNPTRMKMLKELFTREMKTFIKESFREVNMYF